MNPLHEAGIVGRYLRANGFTEADFASRLAIFCLRTLRTKVPVTGGTTAQQARREYVLHLLRDAMAGPDQPG